MTFRAGVILSISVFRRAILWKIVSLNPEAVRNPSKPIAVFQLTLRRDRLTNVSWMLAYFTGLMLLYTYWVSPLYGYQGFLADFDRQRLLSSVVALIALVYWAGFNTRPSSVFIAIAILVIFIPSCVLYVMGVGGGRYFAISVMSIAMLILTTKIRAPTRLGVLRISSYAAMAAACILTLVVLGGILTFGGVQYLNFDVTRVYEFRRVAAGQLPAIFGYLIPITEKALIPLTLVIAAHRKSPVFFAAAFACSIMLFALTSHKSPLIFPFFIVGLYYFLNSTKVVKFLAIGAFFIVFLSWLDFLMKDIFGGDLFGWFGAIFGVRGLLVPSYLNHLYIDFFYNMEHFYWSSSRLTMGLVEKPHSLNAPNLIGLHYFGNNQMSANAGWVGSGYANAGLLGVMIYSFLIGLGLKLLDSYAIYLGSRFVIPVFFVPVAAILASSDITDIILTHGLAVLIGFLIIISRGGFVGDHSSDPRHSLKKSFG